MELKQNLTATAIAIITAMIISGELWSWPRAAALTVGGAVRGAYAGPVGLVWGFNGAVARGAAIGVATNYLR